MKLPFRSKKQIEQLKQLPIGHEKVMAETTVLSLSSLRITYNQEFTQEKYRASVSYAERPTDWTDHGFRSDVELRANSWEEIIDKVITCFASSDQETHR